MNDQRSISVSSGIRRVQQYMPWLAESSTNQGVYCWTLLIPLLLYQRRCQSCYWWWWRDDVSSKQWLLTLRVCETSRHADISNPLPNQCFPTWEHAVKEAYLYSAFYILCISQSAQTWITQFYLQIHHACLSFVSVHQMAPPLTEVRDI